MKISNPINVFTMATSYKVLSTTMRCGSDVIYDYYCEPCSAEGQDIEASGYCQQCSVYLCSVCCKAHRKSPASTNHILLDSDAMPRMEYADIAVEIDRLVATASNASISFNQDEETNRTYKLTAIAGITSARQQMDKMLDAAERRALQRVDQQFDENTEKINSASLKCQSVLLEAKAIAAALDTKDREGQINKQFAEMKLARRRLPTMEEEINQLTEQKISHYTFATDGVLQHFSTTLSAMFSISVTKDNEGPKVRHFCDVNVKAAEDSKVCLITGIAALSEDRLVVTDFENNAVKLVNIPLNKVTSRLTLSSKPFDVARTDEDQVAVTLGQERKIEIFTATDILTRTKTINVPGRAFTSVCYAGDTFIVLYYTARAVKEVDMSGRVVRTIYLDSDSEPLFKKPRYISLDNTNDVIYITDHRADTVTCMTPRGKIIWIYKHAGLKYPMGVAIGREGNLMVCSRDTHTVQLLSRSGQIEQVLLDKQRGLAPFPMAICVCGDKLVVSSAGDKAEVCDYASMFQI